MCSPPPLVLLSGIPVLGFRWRTSGSTYNVEQTSVDGIDDDDDKDDKLGVPGLFQNKERTRHWRTGSRSKAAKPLLKGPRGYVTIAFNTRCVSLSPHPSLSPSNIFLSAMAAPVHYIRTIHTSFTASHPRSSTAWANAAAVRSQHQYLPFSASISSHNSQIYQQHLQQQHNFQYQQQQHQQPPQYVQSRKSTTSLTGGSAPPSPAGAGGRRRATSIRAAPSSPSPSPCVKFDPFADEPPSAPFSSPLTPSSQVNRISHTQNHTYNNRDYHQQHPSSGSGSAASTPITIHIPAAAPIEIKRYSTSPNRRISNLGSADSISTANGGGSTFLGGSTIPSAVPTLNPSKIVAGILLNRVHAVGKPMRRRLPVLSGPKQYVKSGLSSVVSVEAS